MNIMYHQNGDYLLPDMGLNETDKGLHALFSEHTIIDGKRDCRSGEAIPLSMIKRRVSCVYLSFNPSLNALPTISPTTR